MDGTITAMRSNTTDGPRIERVTRGCAAPNLLALSFSTEAAGTKQGTC